MARTCRRQERDQEKTASLTLDSHLSDSGELPGARPACERERISAAAPRPLLVRASDPLALPPASPLPPLPPLPLLSPSESVNSPSLSSTCVCHSIVSRSIISDVGTSFDMF